MKISLDWLSDFIEITEKDHEKIKDIITERSAEVETLENQGNHLEKVVVGKVTELKKHSNADSLSLTKVSDGKEEWKVVCGGSNLREGMLVAFAQLGAVVKWHGDEVMEMKKVKIRGEESFGMICAAEELGLSDMFPKQAEKEIVDLTSLNLKVGEPLAKALGLDDVVLDVDNHAITNRPDLFSQKGFAREFVANGLGKLKPPRVYHPPTDGSKPPIHVQINSPELCRRYMAVYLTGIQVQDSPDWMKKRLIACGINPISNLVDLTNYVMLELGMPLHAFDVERIQGKQWVMRKSKQGEKVTTLDEQVHELPNGVVVLNDGNENFDLCGVMGGLNSGIHSTTEKVWLHAPVYHPTLVRQAMRGLGHVSDAGIIYEKGVDPMLAEAGLNRAIELILELCPEAKVASEMVDIFPNSPEKRVLTLRSTTLEKLLGDSIPAKTVEKILTDLGFGVKTSKNGYEVTVPSFRLNDVHREADLVEEVGRIYGYNNLPYQDPVLPLKPVPVNLNRRRERQMKNELVSYGFDEIYTFAFLGPDLLEKAGQSVTDEMIEVMNPISSDLSLMRTSLLPRMLETIAENQRYQEQFRLFELSRVYLRENDEAHSEPSRLVLATFGEDFRALQGVVEQMGYGTVPTQSELKDYMHPGRVADLRLRGKTLGQLYQLHPSIAKVFDLKKEVVVAEVDVQLLHELNIDAKVKYQDIPRFPSVQLDVSILVPEKSLSGDYQSTMEKADKKLIQSVNLIDEYAGDKIPEGKRALTYSITYQAADRTLTDEEVNAVHQQVLKKLEGKGAEVRK